MHMYKLKYKKPAWDPKLLKLKYLINKFRSPDYKTSFYYSLALAYLKTKFKKNQVFWYAN